MDTNHFLLLLSLKASNAAIGRSFLQRIKADVDANAAPLWVDSRGIGVFISTQHPAWKLWALAFPAELSQDQRLDLKDFLVLQVGPDYCGDPNHKASAWLNARFPRR